MSVKNWQIYCNTENKFVSGWGANPPTTCYNNSNDSVNTDSVQQIEENITLPQFAFLKNIESLNTNGGAYSNSGVWVTRSLNTLVTNINWCALSNNQFTLQQGNYLITASAPAYGVTNHKIRLQNITGNTTVGMGVNMQAQCSGIVDTMNMQTFSNLTCYVNIAIPSVFEIQHICDIANNNSTALGLANGLGSSEIYTQVQIARTT